MALFALLHWLLAWWPLKRLGRRVLALTDGNTDRAAALGETEVSPKRRFVWLDTSRPDRAGRREVLESLFGMSGGSDGK